MSNGVSFTNIINSDVVTGDITVISGIGFNTQPDQQQFIGEVNKLRDLISGVKKQIESEASNSNDTQELVAEISLQIKALQEATTQASQLSIGKEIPPEKAKSLAAYLQSAQTLIEKIQKFSGKVKELAIDIAPLALPILTQARKLLGLP